MVNKSVFTDRRMLEERRKTAVQGVTGYDRRKRARRGSPGNPAVWAAGAPGGKPDDLDFTDPKRKR